MSSTFPSTHRHDVIQRSVATVLALQDAAERSRRVCRRAETGGLALASALVIGALAKTYLVILPSVWTGVPPATLPVGTLVGACLAATTLHVAVVAAERTLAHLRDPEFQGALLETEHALSTRPDQS